MDFKDLNEIVRNSDSKVLFNYFIDQAKDVVRGNPSILDNSKSVIKFYMERFLTISNLQKGFFNDKKYDFVEGHINYLCDLFTGLPDKDIIATTDLKFFYYQADIINIFNGLNQFLVVVMGEKQSGHIYFLPHFEDALENYKTIDNAFLFDHIQLTLLNFHSRLLWQLRNVMVHGKIDVDKKINMPVLMIFVILHAMQVYSLSQSIICFGPSEWPIERRSHFSQMAKHMMPTHIKSKEFVLRYFKESN